MMSIFTEQNKKKKYACTKDFYISYIHDSAANMIVDVQIYTFTSKK